jgi:hypothetical protein
MTRRLRGAVLIASIATLVAACGGSSPGAASTASPGGVAPGQTGGGAAASVDSCRLLGDDAILAGTGERVSSKAPSTLTQVFSSVCDIELDGGGKLTVRVLPTGGRAMYERSFEPTIGKGDVLDEAVPGLGDKAARAGDDEVMVLVGDTLFDIAYIQLGKDDKLPTIRYLADVAVTRLPCVASGCEGMTAPPAPSTGTGVATDLCGLLTEDEVATAAGIAVASEASGEASSCTWTLQGGSFAGAHYVRLWLIPSGGRQQFDVIANDMYDVDPEHVPGIGDDAVKLGTVPDGSIYAVLGDRLLRLEFAMPLEVQDPYALLVPLARSAASRLP